MSATAILAIHNSGRWQRATRPAQRATAAIAERQWSATGLAYLGAEQGMAILGCSESTWWRSVRAAQAEGLVEKITTGGGRGRANGYRIAVAFERRRPKDNRPSARPLNPVTPGPPTERSSPVMLSRRSGLRPGAVGDGVFRSPSRPAQRYDRPWGSPDRCGRCRDAGVVLLETGGAIRCPDCNRR